MTRTRTIVRGLTISFAFAFVFLAWGGRKAMACDSSHGIYTQQLCVGDHMTGDGAYIISSNGLWRLYISGGNLSGVYDVNQSDSWSWTVVDASAHNSYAYGAQVVPLSGCSCGGQLELYDTSYNVWWAGFDADLGSLDTDYIEMTNSGCAEDIGTSGGDEGGQCP